MLFPQALPSSSLVPSKGMFKFHLQMRSTWPPYKIQAVLPSPPALLQFSIISSTYCLLTREIIFSFIYPILFCLSFSADTETLSGQGSLSVFAHRWVLSTESTVWLNTFFINEWMKIDVWNHMFWLNWIQNAIRTDSSHLTGLKSWTDCPSALGLQTAPC